MERLFHSAIGASRGWRGDVLVPVNGGIDLANERVALTVLPEPE
jgi:hypothetical protein